MVTRNADSSHQQGDGTVSSAHPVSAEQLRSHAGSTVNGLSASGADNTVFKSGPLLVSSKGIGWTSWKKRWFILTRTSLVFFRSDPSVAPQRGSEANLTLGGIDLNNSASVVVRADKKLLTVLFPDGRDGRAFTLKAETSEDMHEWKTALEAALAQAPGATATLAVEQSGIFQNDSADAIEGSFEQWRDKRPVKSSVIGRPVLLALEDADGSPSFLEKALRFVEQYGVKVEGILRQSADVDEVEHRVQEYEQGKNEFSPDEDAHLVVDCIKHVLRELPYSPVPASCCTSLLEAFRTGHGSRVNALHNTISRTFPEPNRRLLHRILKMMRTVVYHKSENRMSTSAVAACMAPLLLRPLLAGDCEVENDFNMGGDGSLQLLRAAAAANHAQAIVITLLEEYSNIFLDGSFSPDLCSESEGSGSEYEGSTDDEALDDDVYDDAEDDIDGETEDDHECALSGSLSDNNGDVGSELDDNEVLEDIDSEPKSPKVDKDFKAGENLTKETHDPILRQQNIKSSDDMQSLNNHSSAVECCEPVGNAPNPTSPKLKSTSLSPSSCIPKSTTKSNDPAPTVKRRTIWGRTAAKKNLSMESIEFPCEDEMEIQRLETIKVDLKTKITVEANGNEILQGSLERRKQAMLEQRLALEQDVARLEDQLQRERNLRATLEAGVNMPLEHLSIPSNVDSKIRAEIEETVLAEAEVSSLKQKVADLHVQIDQQREHTYGSVCESCGRPLPTSNQQTTRMAQQKDTGSTPAHERFSASEDALPGACEGLPTQVLLPISNNHPPKERDSTDQNCTKSTGASTFLSPDCDRVITQDPPFSKQQSPKKQHPIANTPSGSLSVRTQVLPSSSENQSPQKQHPDSTGTSDFSGASLSVKAQASMSSSENQGPQKLHPDSTGTTDLSGGSLNVKSRASPSSSDNQGPQKQHPDSTGTTDLSGGSLTVKSRASLSSSEKQGPQKQHPDSTGTTSNLSSGYPSVETRAPLSASENQAPQRQQQDSTGINTNLSRSSLSVKTRAPLSSSENQALQKQQREKTLQNGTKFDGTMTSLASYRESVATQEPPSFSGKQPNHKQQPDSPYPNRNKFGGATTSSMTEFEKVVAQCPPSLSDKQFPYNQQPDSTSKNNKSKGATTGSLSEEPLKVGITASKKSAGKGEGTASAPYAMTRLTNLLNYMKERRSLVDEIQNQDASNTRVSEGPLLSRPPETHSR